MEGREENDFKKQYDELLTTYTQKRSQCENIEREIKLAREDIEEIKNKIREIEVPQGQATEANDAEGYQQEKQELVSQYEQLNSKLNSLDSEFAQTDPKIQQLKSQLQTLQKTLQSLTYAENREEKERAGAELASIQRKTEEEERRLKEMQIEVENQEKRLKDLQKEVAVLGEVKLESESTTDFLSNLENELKQLEVQESLLAEDLKKQVELAAEQSKKTESQQKTLKEELLQLSGNNSHLKTTLAKLEQDCKKIYLPKTIDISEITKLQDGHKEVLREIEELTKEVANKKLEEIKRKQEAKKEKHKEKRNFKQEIIEMQNIVQMQSKELQREKAKLENTIKLRKSYVSQESLQILQKEYERQQVKGKPNLQSEEKLCEKLVKEKEMIKARIYFLKHAAKELEEDGQTKLKELRQKGEELVKEKLANEKVFSDNTYKVNEYAKEFPDHEKKKEEAKNEEKKKKQELKEQQKLEQQRKSAQRLKQQKATMEKALPEDQNQAEWEKWDKWDESGKLPQRDEKSIFNNRQFQLATAVVAFIVILILSFS